MDKKSLIVIISLIFSAIISASAQTDIEKVFSYESEVFGKMRLNYRKAEVGKSSEIIVVYLHGGSGQGVDNKTHMKTPAIDNIYNYLVDNGKNFIFLVPQVPYGQQWMGLAVPALKDLLDKYSDNGEKDIYILGASMGGAGTWNMLAAYPGYFSGAMPVAIGTPNDKVDNYPGIRIYSVIGGEDRRRNFRKCKSFFDKLTKNGGVVKLDVENRWGHRQTCEESFTPERLSWLFN